jgi:hypothetical protein
VSPTHHTRSAFDAKLTGLFSRQTEFTFREARKRSDFAAPSLRHLEILSQSLLALRPSCQHGLLDSNDCPICSDYLTLFTSYCNNLLKEYVTFSKWHSLSTDQKRAIVRIVAQTRDNLVDVIAHEHVSGDLLYLWIVSHLSSLSLNRSTLVAERPDLPLTELAPL